MPELPDVEGFRRVLTDHAVGHRVERVVVVDSGVLRGVSPRRLRTELRDRRFTTPWRHGKWLVAPTAGGPTVLFHFGMTGSLTWADNGEERHRHDRVVLRTDNGELCFRDMRKLQGIRLAPDRHALDRALADLGPDALDISRHAFVDALRGLRRQVKTALVDQTLIAGLGNLLADEILWRARIHPRRPCVHLGHRDLTRLHARTGTVLRRAVQAGRVPPRETWLTGHRDDAPGACPRCGAALAHGRVGGRGTAWCPHCQQ